MHAAKIATFGEQVVDVFYVQDIFGTKVDQLGKIENVRAVILAALNAADSLAANPVPISKTA